MNLRIGTWNVAAFRTIKSADKFDYSENEELSYFADQILLANLDIICLQESHINDIDSQAQRLATILGMDYIMETPGCPSHIQKGYMITTAILSRYKFINQSHTLLPRPSFELKINNRVVQPYDRYVQQVQIGNFKVATMHTEPLETLGASYEAGEGKTLAKEIDRKLTKALSAPCIFAADFNMENLSKTLPDTLNHFTFKDVLHEQQTTPTGKYPDHILISSEWELIDSGIIRSKSDHYLCWSELNLKNHHNTARQSS